MDSVHSLPGPVISTLKAIHDHDAEHFIASFDTDATVTDEGITKTGHAAIKAWSITSLFEHNTTVSPKKVTRNGEHVIIEVVMDGDFKESHGITEPFTLYLDFKLGSDSIKSLQMTPLDPTKPSMLAVYAVRENLADPLSVVRVGRRPVPTVPEGWVKVKITAASLNWHDILTLMGIGVRPFVFPLTIGCDGCGTLEDGTEVILYPVIGDPDFRGDETLDPQRNILSEDIPGTLAEYVIVPRRNAVPRPKEISVHSAAVLGIAWLTAYRMLFTHATLRAGQVMLVQGSSGGTSTALIQMGSAAGFRVWAVGRSVEKRSLATRLGAERTFEPGEKLPNKVDAVFDLAGEASWAHSMDSVKAGGMILTCGIHSGATVSFELHRLFVEQITIKGVYTGTLDEFKDLISFVAGKKIVPLIGQVLPMTKAIEGLRKLQTGVTMGKIVLTL